MVPWHLDFERPWKPLVKALRFWVVRDLYIVGSILIWMSHKGICGRAEFSAVPAVILVYIEMKVLVGNMWSFKTGGFTTVVSQERFNLLYLFGAKFIGNRITFYQWSYDHWFYHRVTILNLTLLYLAVRRFSEGSNQEVFFLRFKRQAFQICSYLQKGNLSKDIQSAQRHSTRHTFNHMQYTVTPLEIIPNVAIILHKDARYNFYGVVLPSGVSLQFYISIWWISGPHLKYKEWLRTGVMLHRMNLILFDYLGA